MRLGRNSLEVGKLGCGVSVLPTYPTPASQEKTTYTSRNFMTANVKILANPDHDGAARRRTRWYDRCPRRLEGLELDFLR